MSSSLLSRNSQPSHCPTIEALADDREEESVAWHSCVQRWGLKVRGLRPTSKQTTTNSPLLIRWEIFLVFVICLWGLQTPLHPKLRSASASAQTAYTLDCVASCRSLYSSVVSQSRLQIMGLFQLFVFSKTYIFWDDKTIPFLEVHAQGVLLRKAQFEDDPNELEQHPISGTVGKRVFF